MHKKYKILLIGIVLLATGLAVTIVSFSSTIGFMGENAVFNSQPIAPQESVTKSFTLDRDFDLRFYVNSLFLGEILEVTVFDDEQNEIFKKTIHEKLETNLQDLETGIYYVSIKNTGDEYARVTVHATEQDGVNRADIFFGFVYVTIIGIIMAISGFIIMVIGTVKFFHYRNEERHSKHEFDSL